MPMTRVESGHGSLRHLPLDRIMVDIPIDSPEYQAFLEANRLREQAREESGGPDPEAEARYREAAAKVSQLAKGLYARGRAS